MPQSIIWWILLLIGITPLTLSQISVSDCWWHLQCGRSLIQNWHAPDFHTFYYTPVQSHVLDLRWTFLGDVFLYGAYTIGGTYAIQCLIALLVVSTILLILSICHWQYEWFTLPLTIAFTIGSYQLQLHRNAAFSILFVAAIFWIFFQAQARRIKWMIWLFPPLIGIWGAIHGSYLLGFVLICLLLVGDVVDVFMGGERIHFSQLGKYSSVILAALLLTQVWNPMTTLFLTRPFRYIQSQYAGPAAGLRDGKGKKSAISLPNSQSENVDKSQSTAPATERPIFSDGKEKDLKRPASEIQPGGSNTSQWAEPSNVLSLQQALPPETAAGRIKKFLNSSIWPEIESLPRSGDFLSPFDRLEYLPVTVSFALGFIAIFDLLFCSSRCRFSLLIPLAGTFAIGLAYVRLTGYIAAVSFCTIALNSQWRTAGASSVLTRSTWISISASLMWIVTLYQALFTGALPGLIGEPNYIFGFGKIPTYDDRICDYIREDYSDKNVFTTIVSGSFALFKWYPDKKVFIDGFFAPHPSKLWRDYKETPILQHPDLLYDRYGAELALIEHDRLDWNITFLNGESWQPVAIGLGDVLYRYQRHRSSDMPRLLFRLPEVKRMPPYFRQTLAYDYYSSIISVSYFTENAETLTKADRAIFYGLQPDLAPNERHLFEEALSHVTFD